jgi:NADH-quinone oxidoreductase subunit L
MRGLALLAEDPVETPLQVVQQASGVFSLTWLLVALPLLGAGLLLVGGRRTNRWGPYLAVAMVWVAFLIGAAQFVSMLGEPSDQRAFGQDLYTWAAAGMFDVHVGFLVDQLSMVFVLLITFVGGLIHIYSLGYMSHDVDRRRFFGYLNLFVASMLMLVLAGDYVMVYVGWEGVGLASYLLIGFWNQRSDYATAGNKAFIMNRVGDMGMAVAIMVLFATFGTTTFSGVFAGVSEASSGTVLALGLLLLLAAVGKSAQLPLQAWLLDAMAGPTPVSALIHAATMVTAGVYLIVRSGPIFNLSEGARLAVAIVGVSTLLLGALIGTAKDDIKKALAGSTMSQIGYMVLAAGLGPAGYAFAIFHLLMHGFFKANMFLGAGSVMHAMNDELDMRRYGGLRKVMPITFLTFMAGYLAIIGFPFTDGFFSKDKIIEAALGENIWLGLLAALGAGITGYYMTRLVLLTFFGERRWAESAQPHESPTVMTGPLVVLGVLSLFAGLFLAWGNRFVDWLAPVVGEPVEHTFSVPVWVISALIFALVLVGAGWAYMQYGRRLVPVTAPVGSPLTVAARRNFFDDAVNETLVMRPAQYLTRFLVWFDIKVVDGAVNGSAALIGGSSGRMRRWQTGFVRSYALSMFAGAVLLIGALVLVRM